IKADAEDILCQAAHGDEFGIIVKNFAVDLVSEDDQVVAASQLNNLFQNFSAVYRAGRVVWVDDHDAAGLIRYLAFNVSKIREPIGLLVAKVVPCFTTCKIDRCSPQRVIGSWHQDFV